MKFLGITLQRPTFGSVTVAGVYATLMMLVLLLLHQTSAEPLHARGVAAWWVLGFWLGLTRRMGIRPFRQLAPTAFVMGVGVLILLAISATGPM